MGDYYLSHSLHKPKKEIADYVESQGIVVPRRFESLKEARASGNKIIVRSEHSQDYDGVSGLFASFLLEECEWLNLSSDSTDKQLQTALRQKAKKKDLVKLLCESQKKDTNEFVGKLSCSFWQYVSGINQLVVADSAVKGRYHIITTRDSRGWSIGSYVVFEKGNKCQLGKKLPLNAEKQLDKLVQLYEQIRCLSRFDNQHCPIMEFQSGRKKIYFLQYRRARDFAQASFRLNDSDKRVLFVRGATPPEGITFTLPIVEFPVFLRDRGILDIEPASFPGLLSRKNLYLMQPGMPLDNFMSGCSDYHTSTQKLFLPCRTIVVEHFISYEERVRAMRLQQKQDILYLKVHIVSDGARVRIKREKNCFVKKISIRSILVR